MRPAKGPIMTRWQLLIPITLALGACAEIGTGRSQTLTDASAAAHRLTAADPAARRDKSSAPAVTSAAAAPTDREAELALLPQGSKEWWKLHDEIEAEADARLAKALIICSGCFATDTADQTASIK